MVIYHENMLASRSKLVLLDSDCMVLLAASSQDRKTIAQVMSGRWYDFHTSGWQATPTEGH